MLYDDAIRLWNSKSANVVCNWCGNHVKENDSIVDRFDHIMHKCCFDDEYFGTTDVDDYRKRKMRS